MDKLQEDLWELKLKHNVRLNDLKFKINQMIQEHEYHSNSGIVAIKYNNDITIINECEVTK